MRAHRPARAAASPFSVRLSLAARLFLLTLPSACAAVPSRYKSDLFGLQTVDKAGKILFNTTEGNHLQFSQEQLKGWVDYFV